MTSRECWKQVTGITGWLKKFPAHSPPSLSGKPSIWARAGAAYALCAPNAPAEPCRFPDRAMASLEAYGVAVSELAEACGMKYINGQSTVTYFGAFLYRKAEG